MSKINLDDLTIGQVKEIQSFQQNQHESTSFLKKYIGKYVICRTRNEGINSGFVKEIDETGVVLSEARRIYYHKPKDKNSSWYEGVANSGLSNDSKISVPVIEKVIVEDYSLTICSEEAKELISKHKSHVQN